MRLLGALIVAVLRWRNRRRHQRCLARIERLERAVFPEYFDDEFSFAPGARWLVGSHNYIQIMPAFHQPTEGRS